MFRGAIVDPGAATFTRMIGADDSLFFSIHLIISGLGERLGYGEAVQHRRQSQIIMGRLPPCGRIKALHLPSSTRYRRGDHRGGLYRGIAGVAESKTGGQRDRDDHAGQYPPAWATS